MERVIEKRQFLLLEPLLQQIHALDQEVAPVPEVVVKMIASKQPSPTTFERPLERAFCDLYRFVQLLCASSLALSG